MADTQANPLDRLDPELALRHGDFDAHVVLFLWCVRKSFYPLLWLGLAVSVIAFGDVDAVTREIESLDNPQAMLSSLLSPFGVIVVAFGIRIIASWLGLAAAYPLTLSARRSPYEAVRISRWFHLWRDRLYQARAYRSLRQTWAVRQRAYHRLDVAGRVYRILELTLIWANIVFLIGFVIVAGAVAGESVG